MHLNSLVRVNPSLYVVTTADCLFSKLRLFSKTHCVYIKLKNAPPQSVVSNAFSGIWDLGSGVIKTREYPNHCVTGRGHKRPMPNPNLKAVCPYSKKPDAKHSSSHIYATPVTSSARVLQESGVHFISILSI